MTTEITSAINDDSSCKIFLRSRGKPTEIFAIVDKDVYDDVNKYKWNLNKDGYAQGDVAGKTITMHKYLKGQAPRGQVIDHKNLNKLDNRKDNLKFSTISQNTQNRAKKSNTSSVYKGVTWDKIRNKWKAAIKHEGKPKNLGSFDNEIEAAEAYDTAAFLIHGQDARTNNLVKYEDIKDITLNSIVKKRKINNNPYIFYSVSRDSYQVQIMYKRISFKKSTKTFQEAEKILEGFKKEIELIKRQEQEKHYQQPILYDENDNAIIQVKTPTGEIDNVIVDANKWHKLMLYKWTRINKGYYTTSKLGQMHRYLLGLSKDNNKLVDHKDQNKKNNKINNLHPVDASTNAQNRSKLNCSKYTSKYRGVSKKKSGNFQAAITKKCKKTNIGMFTSEIEAAKAYDEYAIKLFGPNALTNFPKETSNQSSTSST